MALVYNKLWFYIFASVYLHYILDYLFQFQTVFFHSLSLAFLLQTRSCKINRIKDESVREVTWDQVVSDKWLGSSVSGDLGSSGVRGDHL